MSLARLYYLACDVCGNPAGTDEQMGDTPAQARRNARAIGWSVGPGNQAKCRDCLARASDSEEQADTGN